MKKEQSAKRESVSVREREGERERERVCDTAWMNLL